MQGGISGTGETSDPGMEKAFVALSTLVAFVLSFAYGPRALCQRGADRFWNGEPAALAAFGRNVDRHVRELDSRSFSTGSRRFDGEWRFGTAMMAALGFGQLAAEHPELAAESLARMDHALDVVLSSEARAFDREAWGEDPLESLAGDRGHAAYLGYANLALSLRRFLEPGSRFAERNDQLSAALERRLERAPNAVLQTYPGEIYPVDNAAGVASLVLRARALGRAPPPVAMRWLSLMPARFVDPETGLLFQAVDAEGRPSDRPRGSGTALAAYFLSFADQDGSRRLHRALRRELAGDVVGFGVVREYPPGEGGRGDIDSGPLVFGWSISAMGFGLSGCRIHGERACFDELYRAYSLFGAPSEERGELTFASGGPLGNAIVFAMLTAQPAARWWRS